MSAIQMILFGVMFLSYDLFFLCSYHFHRKLDSAIWREKE